jgi:hypothetical protein
VDPLERLSPPGRRFFLSECRRVLSAGGRLRLVAAAARAGNGLDALLKECGFRDVRASAHMGSDQAELKLEEASGLDAASAASRIHLEAQT